MDAAVVTNTSTGDDATIARARTDGIGERPAIDLAHLRRYTFGDRNLELEVLGLFEQQANEVINSLADTPDSRDWTIAVHTVKGSARAVGAFEIATLAEKLEVEGRKGNRSAELIDEITAAFARACRFIEQNRGTVSVQTVSA